MQNLQLYVENYGGEEAFNSALEQNGMTEKEFKENIVELFIHSKIN